jgi:26S proteasome regulatory subunit N2
VGGQVVCKCKPSLFAYPSAVTQETASAAAKVPTAVLSTTARAREKAKKKEAEKSVKTEGDKPASASDEAGLHLLPYFLPFAAVTQD